MAFAKELEVAQSAAWRILLAMRNQGLDHFWLDASKIEMDQTEKENRVLDLGIWIPRSQSRLVTYYHAI